MNNLLKLAIDAQGGLDLWRKFNTVSAHLKVGGLLWATKGHDGTIENVNVVVNLLEQKTSHIPSDQWHTAYSPDRVAIETNDGKVVEELFNPRASFGGHLWETPWSNLQLAYFSGYAMWNYLNTPYQFTRPGFETTEIDPWQENGEVWRRLKVRWPKDIHTHSKEQVFYINAVGLITRLDYDVEITGHASAAHYLSDYKDVSGIKLATKRVVYQRNKDNTPALDGPVVVSIQLSDIVFN